jgi:ABC-type transport system substrate-binding protein
MPPSPSVRIPLAGLTRQLDNDSPDYLIGSPGLYLCLALAYDSLAAPANVAGDDGVSSPDFTRMQPRLARQWVRTTPRSWEVALRPGVLSHAGNELGSEDIAWAFRKNFATPVMAAWRWRDSAGIDGPDDVVPLDTHRVRYQVRVANPNFPAYLQWLTPNIVDSKAISAFAMADDPWGIAWLDDNVAGFGAYDMASFDDDHAEFVSRSDYWTGEVEVGRVELDRVGSRAEALSQLDGPGPVVVLGLDADESRAALARPDVDVQRTWAGHVRVQLDFRVAPFGDRRVRQALAFATPYQAIIDDGFRGLARPWRSPIKGISPWYTDRYWQYETNLATARRLLAEAGLGSGFTTDLHFDHRPDCDRVALVLQEAWREIGVELTLHHLPATGDGYLPMVLSTDCGHNLSEPLYDLVHDFAAIASLFPEISTEDGVGKWHPYLVRQDEIIVALREALTQTDEAVLHRHVDELQRRILTEAGTIHVAEVQQTLAAKNVPRSFYSPDSRFFHAMQYQNARCDTYLPWWDTGA